MTDPRPEGGTPGAEPEAPVNEREGLALYRLDRWANHNEPDGQWYISSGAMLADVRATLRVAARLRAPQPTADDPPQGYDPDADPEARRLIEWLTAAAARGDEVNAQQAQAHLFRRISALMAQAGGWAPADREMGAVTATGGSPDKNLMEPKEGQRVLHDAGIFEQGWASATGGGEMERALDAVWYEATLDGELELGDPSDRSRQARAAVLDLWRRERDQRAAWFRDADAARAELYAAQDDLAAALARAERAEADKARLDSGCIRLTIAVADGRQSILYREVDLRAAIDDAMARTVVRATPPQHPHTTTGAPGEPEPPAPWPEP